MPDVIDILAGVSAGSAIDIVRRRRSVARDHAQASWEALFQPAPGSFSIKDRYAVALFVAALSGDETAADFYRAGLVREGGEWASAVEELAASGLTQGPYGRWAHHSALGAEGTDGLRWAVPAASPLGAPLSAALTAAHRLVFRPRESSQADLVTLLEAGWSEADVVSLSQLVAFLSFQLRVAHGLRVLVEVVK